MKVLLRFVRTRLFDQGFTLVELMIVIVIVGILSSVAVPYFQNQAVKAEATEARSKMNGWLKELLAMYSEGADNSEMQLFLTHASTGVMRLENQVPDNYFEYAVGNSPTRGTGVVGPGTRIYAHRQDGDLKKWIYACVAFETGKIEMTQGIREFTVSSTSGPFGPGMDPNVDCGIY